MRMSDRLKEAPLTFKLASWYGLGFAGCYLLYGGVKIILGILDRNYADMGNPIVFTIVGLVLIAVAFGFVETRKWGWYGLIVTNGLVVVTALISYSNYLDIILVILSAVALYLLMAEPTRRHLAAGR